MVRCDSCFVYVLEEDELVLRASKTPHPDVVDRLKLRVGQGITGWVAEHRSRSPSRRARSTIRASSCSTSCPRIATKRSCRCRCCRRGKLVGVINLQHRQPHEHSRREIQLISTIGFLVGAEIEMARLEAENTQLSERLETRKVLDRAKGILQRDLGISEEEAYLTDSAPEPAAPQVEEGDRRGDRARRRSETRKSPS